MGSQMNEAKTSEGLTLLEMNTHYQDSGHAPNFHFSYERPMPRLIAVGKLAYGILCINNRLTYTTNEVLLSKDECRFYLFDIDLHLPKRLGICKLFTQS